MPYIRITDMKAKHSMARTSEAHQTSHQWIDKQRQSIYRNPVCSCTNPKRIRLCEWKIHFFGSNEM